MENKLKVFQELNPRILLSPLNLWTLILYLLDNMIYNRKIQHAAQINGNWLQSHLNSGFHLKLNSKLPDISGKNSGIKTDN